MVDDFGAEVNTLNMDKCRINDDDKITDTDGINENHPSDIIDGKSPQQIPLNTNQDRDEPSKDTAGPYEETWSDCAEDQNDEYYNSNGFGKGENANNAANDDDDFNSNNLNWPSGGNSNSVNWPGNDNSQTTNWPNISKNEKSANTKDSYNGEDYNDDYNYQSGYNQNYDKRPYNNYRNNENSGRGGRGNYRGRGNYSRNDYNQPSRTSNYNGNNNNAFQNNSDNNYRENSSNFNRNYENNNNYGRYQNQHRRGRGNYHEGRNHNNRYDHSNERDGNEYRWKGHNHNAVYNNDRNHHNYHYQNDGFSNNNNNEYDYNRDNFDDGRYQNNNIYESPGPVTYEPEILNFDKEQLFSNKTSQGIDFSNYKSVNVEVTGGDGTTVEFIKSFEKSKLHPSLLENVKLSNYSIPTPIQQCTLPIIMNTKCDIMGCAQTGSGKTAAFVLPIFSKLLNEEDLINIEDVPSPYVLCIAPTRELVQQIFFVMQKLSWNTKINCARVYGGLANNFMMRGLTQDCHSLVATPGRLLSYLSKGTISMRRVKYLILDEADRMLDESFAVPIRNIINCYGMPAEVRSFMFSATLSSDVQKLASDVVNLKNYFYLSVGIVGGAAETIVQRIQKLKVFEKRNELITFLENVDTTTKVLIFVETKRQADYLTVFLCTSNFNAISIHGDRKQEQREQALKLFTDGVCSILVATDVAARGLDIPMVDVVFNYDMPNAIDQYVHRIGRTGRIGNRGLSISFFQEDRDEPLASDLERILKDANQEIPSWLSMISSASVRSRPGYKMNRDYRTINNGGNVSSRNYKARTQNPYPSNEQRDFDNQTNSAWTNTPNSIAQPEEEEYW